MSLSKIINVALCKNHKIPQVSALLIQMPSYFCEYMIFLFLVFQIFQHFVNFKLVLPFMLFFAASGYSFDNGKLGTVCETLGRPSKYGCMYKYSLAVWAVRCVISSWGQLIFVLLSIHVLVWTHLFNYWSLLRVSPWPGSSFPLSLDSFFTLLPINNYSPHAIPQVFIFLMELVWFHIAWLIWLFVLFCFIFILFLFLI